MRKELVLKAVLEPRRRTILRLVADGPLSVTELAAHFDVSRPAVSQHLAVLRGAGLVELRDAGGRTGYAVRPGGLERARSALAAVAAELPGDAHVEGVRVLDTEDPLVVEVAVAAPRETVFALFVEPSGLGRWLGQALDVDPRPGGRFRVDLGGDVARGTFTAVEPPGRVALTWGQEGDGGLFAPGATSIEVDLLAVGAATRVHLAHHELPLAARAGHLLAWSRGLAALAAAAAL